MVQPPPVSGIGNAGGFRMMVEDRAGPRPAGAAGRGRRHDGDARRRRRACPRCSRCSRPRRRSSISISTAPRRSSSASTCRTCSPRCRSISARPTSTTSICSAAPSASPRRPMRATAWTPRTCLNIRVRNSAGDTVPLGSFTTVRNICRAVPRAALQPLSGGRARRRAGARLLAGPGDRDHGEARRRDAARRLRLRVDDARVPADRAPATPRCSRLRWRWCSCSWCWRRSSKA